MDKTTYKFIIRAQKSEITEHHIYNRLAKRVKDKNNKAILEQIAKDEKRHYEFWKNYTDKEVKPSKIKIWFYVFISRLLGITFGIKLMENGEDNAQESYEKLALKYPDVRNIINDEHAHEEKLIELIDEERLKYSSSIVLGLNDALVELTGALAGLTFALRKTSLIALAGLVTGISASFSMAASEYLSEKEEGGDKKPLKAAFFTGIAYIFAVAFLIFPYLVFTDPYFCLGFTVLNAVVIILIFTFYTSVAKSLKFGNRFGAMVAISLGVAAFSFGIGYLIRIWLGVEV